MQTIDIVYISAEAIVGLITTVGNCLVLAVIIKTPQLHTVTNVFVGNLAIADIAVGVLVAPCAALSFLGLPHNFYACVFINCLILMFTNVSILMLMSVAIERFIAIKEPFVYQRILTVRRAFYVNFFVWILGAALGLMPMYGWHRGYQTVTYCRFTEMISYEYMVYFQFFGLVLLPLLIMLCIYIYILLIVRKHTRQTNALHSQFRQSKDAKDFNKDVKAAKVFALVILLFGVFWIPVNLFNCVSLFCGLRCIFPYEALLVAIVMSHANSSINPFLYAASNSRIKRGLKELFRIKLSPQDREQTDFYKHRSSNGFSHARDNSVAPMSNADETSHEDRMKVFTVSSKTFPPSGNISVLPTDDGYKTVKPSPSESDNHKSGLQSNSNHTSTSSVSQHSNQDTNPSAQRPLSQSSHHSKEQGLDNANSTPREMNKPLTIPSVNGESKHDTRA
ncbi:unnamed protein product [Candidula unifasciata]|uniref:G-protein coupled receptors family 1 profile domain-containing protein n=1 Tax=Candidula unifasciata TaxID=100452 RepID=A0A8S3Z6M3_9EUPU|nr:unnamed protein product [Candidula unifasciata]